MNIKSILSALLLSSVAIGAMAIPAKRGTHTFLQSDGSQITVTLTGDEHFHTYLTTDGLTIARDAAGDFRYITIDGISDVLAHNPEKRVASERDYLNKEKDNLTVSSLLNSCKERINSCKAAQVATRAGSTQVPNNGSPRIPILLVQYKDVKFKDQDPNVTFTDFFENGEKSARQYFIDQSNGKYTPQFDVYGPVTLTKNRAAYGGNDAYYQEDKGVGNMVGEAVVALDSKIDYSLYDNDGDGECDVMIVLYAGVGEASSGVADAVWPCQWNLSSSEYGKSEYLDKTVINKFAVFNELNGYDTKKIDGIGTFCHEFSHCLGLPDFYDTEYTGNYFGMADWSLMDYGSYNDDGYTPIGYSAYEKEFMGWIDIEEGKENKFYTLPIFNSKEAENDVAIKLTNVNDANEYFILENRQQQGWDEYMPSSGLFIYHVTFSQRAWDDNTVNNYTLQRMTPVPADNSLLMSSDGYPDSSDLVGDLWPYRGNNALTDSSKPAAKVNTGAYLGKPVTEITANSDGTMSLWVMKGFTQLLETPTTLSHKLNSETEAELSWDSPHVGEATFTVEVKEYEENASELKISTVFDSEDALIDWDRDGYCGWDDGYDKGIRLGSAKQNGILTSRPIKNDGEGIITVKLNAAVYNNDGSQVAVGVINANSDVLDEELIDLTSDYRDYTVVLNSGEEQTVYVVIYTTAKKKRFYLYSADVYTGNAAETRAAESAVLTFEGIEGTSHIVSNLKPGGKYTYRIKAIPISADDYNESEWSERKVFDLSEYDTASGLVSIEKDDAAPQYFTLDGLRISSPNAPGIYIVRKGNRTSKMIKK